MQHRFDAVVFDGDIKTKINNLCIEVLMWN